jgi:hypothetical protein
MAGSKGMPIYSASYFTVCIILTRCPETPLIFSQAAEVLSQNETCVSFWGEKLDEQVEGLTTTKKYTQFSHIFQIGVLGISYLSFFSFIQHIFSEPST